MNWILVLLWCSSVNLQYCVPVVMPAFYSKMECPIVGKKATGDGKFTKFICVQKTTD
jgi:hypothetical protein